MREKESHLNDMIIIPTGNRYLFFRLKFQSHIFYKKEIQKSLCVILTLMLYGFDFIIEMPNQLNIPQLT